MGSVEVRNEYNHGCNHKLGYNLTPIAMVIYPLIPTTPPSTMDYTHSFHQFLVNPRVRVVPHGSFFLPYNWGDTRDEPPVSPTTTRNPNDSHDHRSYYYRLVVWNHGILFFPYYIGNFITPTDELIFFRGVGSTTNQILIKLADSSQLVSGLASFTPHKWTQIIYLFVSVSHWLNHIYVYK